MLHAERLRYNDRKAVLLEVDPTLTVYEVRELFHLDSSVLQNAACI
jgi:hypothetical protein